MMNNISRRTFLKGASACSMGLAASNMLGMLGPSAAYAEAPVESPHYQGGSAMKITKVEPILCASRWLLVRVETDSGIVGWGECGAWAWQTATAEALRVLESLLVGQDPFRIEWLWNAMTRTPHFRGTIVNAAISGIDIALWDIKGKALGVPIYQLLGGKVRDKIRAYETTSGKTPEEVASKVKALVDEGWKHVRVRPMSSNASDTVAAMCSKNEAMFKAIRKAVGYEIDLSLEIHRQCKPVEAIEIGKVLDKYIIHFFEDPFNDYPEVAKYVSAQCPIPIANGERCFNIYELANLVDNTDVAYLRPDMCVIGGITAGMKVARIAEAKSVGIIPHNPLGPISTVAALHIDAVAPNFEVQEWPGTFGDFNAMIKGAPLSVEDGYITMPEGPGLGIELVENIAEKFPFQGRKPSWTTHEDGSIIDR